MTDNDIISCKPVDGGKDTSDVSTEHKRRFISEFFLKHSSVLFY